MEALAFRIWQYANPLGWDVTAGDVADELRSTPQMVGIVCRAKGWGSRLRRTEQQRNGGAIGSYSFMAGEVGYSLFERCARLAEEPSE
jgi:hypothetical protein